MYTLTPQFSEIGPFKLTENCENENYELCSNWAGKNRKLRGLLGCLDRKLRGMSMIWNTENCENENYGGENCGVTVYVIHTEQKPIKIVQIYFNIPLKEKGTNACI